MVCGSPSPSSCFLTFSMKYALMVIDWEGRKMRRSTGLAAWLSEAWIRRNGCLLD